MNTPRRIPLRALMVAALLAAGIGVMGVLAQGLPPVGECGIGPGFINCFDPAAQGEMWRALVPIGSRIQPNVNGAGNPQFADPVDDGFGGTAVNEVGDEIWVSTAATLAAAFSQLSPGECTFAHLGDAMGLTRQCEAPDGSMVPPPEGRLFYPAGLAVDGTTVYVSDRMNHRVTTMHFEGDAFSLTHPIGNGEPGTGGYSYTVGAAAGLTGSKLNAPNGLAVDVASHLLVADGGNARIAIFNADGTDAFASHFTVPVHPLVAGEIVPTYVAVTPGASVVAPGTAPANPLDRIVVVDRYKCTAWIMDAGFNPIGTLPAQLPFNEEAGSACVSGAFPYPSAVGELSILTGVTIDADGHIYLADSWNNRVVIYDRDGALLGAIGEPPVLALGEQPPVESLETPSSVLIDHNGRLVVNDSDNLRLAFYEMNFPAVGPPTAAFQFEVPAPGDDIEGFPTALAEQWGFGPGLDPAGRYLKIDTANHRVQRIELADLAIVREQAQASTPLTGTGSFAVAVPAEKIADVAQVTVTVDANELGVVVTSINALPPAQQTLGATTADPNDVPRGSWVEYAFTYTNPTPNQSVTFRINASGNNQSPQPTTADEVIVVVRGVCAGCEAEHTIYDYPAPPVDPPVAAISELTDTGNWFNRRVFVRLSPKNNDASITSIEWFVRGADMPRYGSGIHVSPINVDTPFVDVPFFGPESEITYWPVTVDETVGPKVPVTIQIDMGAPSVTFGGWPAPAGVNSDPLSTNFGEEWYTGDVTGDFLATDEHAGMDLGDLSPDQASGQFTVIGEGRNLFATQTAVDLVDNVGDFRSDDAERGGRVVNIDRTPPAVTAPNIEVVQTGAGFAVLEPGVFAIGLDDIVETLSGVAAIINPDVTGVEFPLGVSTRPFTVRDHAGHVTTVNGTVTVIARSRSTIAALDAQVVYGASVTLSASVLPTTATGAVTFAFGGTTVTDDTIVDGLATVVVPVVTENVGSYTMQVSYGGDAAVAAASTTATVVVTPAPITVRPDHQQKPYGAADPINTLTPRITLGALVGADAFTGAIERAAGENVGDWAITQGTLSLGPNYTLTFIPSELTIVPALLVLAADPKEKVYGDSDPPLTYSFVSGALVGADTITGVPTRTAGELPGLYAISLAAPTAGPNYEISFSSNFLQVVPRDIFVTADTLGKLYGEPDPPLTYKCTPLLVDCATQLVFNDAFEGELRRDAGETPGTYVVHQYGLALPIGYRLHFAEANFVVGRRQATIIAGNATKVWGTIVDPPISVSQVGFLALDNIVLSVSRAPGEDVASYVTTPAADGAALANYDVTPVTGTFTITKARVSVTADDVTVDYGQTPVFAFTYGLFPGTATAADVDVAPTCTVVPAHTNAGTYSITCSGGLDANLDFDYSPGTLRVNRIPADIQAGSGTKVYGTSDAALATTQTGVLAGDIAGITFATTRVAGEAVGDYVTTATATGGASGNYTFTPHAGNFSITQKPITVTATSLTKFFGLADPPLTYAITFGGPLVGTDSFAGALVRDAGEVLGGYAIRQGTLTAGPNYFITFVDGTLTIIGTVPPIAVDDTASSAGAAPVSINVLANDSDPDGGTLSVTAFTQPAGGAAEGVVTTSGNVVVFTPAAGFVGTVTFTYTIGDGQGGSATATVTVTITAPTDCTISGFTTYTQGGWGATPKGNNPAMLLQNKFGLVYPAGLVRIGGAKMLTFTSSTAIKYFLPAGGTPSVLTANATNPTTSSAGVFAGQVLALRLNVDFSRAGITKPGLEDLRYQGYSVGQILDAANRALGGDTAILSQMGLTLAQLNGIVDTLNKNFDNGTTNLGALACPGPNRPPDAVNDSLATPKNTAKTMSVIANDTDPDGDGLTVTAVTQPSMGSVVHYSNGTVTYTPPTNWTGTTSFEYTISDGRGGTDTATVTVMVSSAGCDDDSDHDSDDGDSDDDDGDSDDDGDDSDDDGDDDDCDDHDDHDSDDNHDDGDHDRDCDREHSRNSRCNDNDGWYRDRHDDRDRSHKHNTNGVCADSSHYRSWYR